MYGYIYKITNNLNGHFYIGQHKYDYEKLDESYWGSGLIITEALKKYGRDNFTRDILEFADSKEQLDILEKQYIKELSPYYNIATGGQGGYLGDEVEAKRLKTLRSEEFRQKISKINLGKHMSKEACKKISESKIGKARPQSVKDAVSKANKGRKKTQESIDKQLATRKAHGPYISGMKGKHHTEESKLKCSDSMKLYCQKHPEKALKHSQDLMGKKRKPFKCPKRNKKVFCVETKVIYDSIQEACSQTGLHQSSISKCIAGTYKTAGGYHWEYINEEDY